MSGQVVTVIDKINEEGYGIIGELIQRGHSDINDYLILGVSKKEFQGVYDVLKDKSTIELEEPYDIIGQTIDGDWIVYKEGKVVYIHKSLDKNITETFNMSVKEFLKQVANRNLKSKWMAN